MTEQQYQAHTQIHTYQPHEIQTQNVSEPILSESVPESQQDKGLLTKVREGIQNVTSKLTWSSDQPVREPDHPQLGQNLVYEDRTVGGKIKQGFHGFTAKLSSDETIPNAPQMYPPEQSLGDKIKLSLGKLTPETHREPDHPQLQQNLVNDHQTVGDKIKHGFQSTQAWLFPETQVPDAPPMGEDDRTFGDKIKEGFSKVTPETRETESEHPQLGQNLVYEDNRTLGDKIKEGFQSIKESLMPESQEIPVAPPLGEDNRTFAEKVKENVQRLAPEPRKTEPDHPQLGQNFASDNRTWGDKIKQGFQSTKAGLMPEEKIPDAPPMVEDDRTLGDKIKECIHSWTPETQREPDHPQLQQNLSHGDNRTVGEKIVQGFQSIKGRLIPGTQEKIPVAPPMGEDDRTVGDKISDGMGKLTLGTHEPEHPQLGQNLVYDDHRSVGDKIMDKVVGPEVTSDGIPKVPEEQRGIGERMKEGFQSAQDKVTGETYDRPETRGSEQGTI